MILNSSQAGRVAAALLDTSSDAAKPEPGPALSLDGRQFGNYRISRLVGLGGMGAVYEARQDRTGRRVAVKIVRGEFITADVARRFEHEARILARLQHPGIAQIFEAGTIDSPTGPTPYFAMEFVEGRPLTAHAADLDSRARLSLFLQICEAVEHAHQKGVIHRDLKPANILVTPEGRPRILDFGVARVTDGDVQATTLHTDIGQVVGTLAYMSPEQASGDSASVDTRSDVYALGVILYELLAGKTPLDIAKGGIHEAARVIREEEPTRLGTLDHNLRGDLEVIVAKALEKERDRRYQSVGELAADVRRHLNSEPILARPASVWYQAARLARRNPMAVTGVVSTFVVLVAGLAVSLWLFTSANSAREREREMRVKADNNAAVLGATNEFLTDLLTAPDPSRLGRDARVMDILDRAADRVRVAESTTPEVATSVKGLLGASYLALADPQKAAPLIEDAEAIALRTWGENDPRRIQLLARKAKLRWSQGLFEESGLQYQDALARARQINDREIEFDCLRSIGGLQAELEKFAESERSLREAIALAEGLLNPLDRRVLNARDSLGVVLLRLRKTEEAESIIRAVASDRARAAGPTDYATLSSRNSLAGVLASRGHFQEAAAILVEDLPRWEAACGPDHPETFRTMGNIAGFLFEMHDLPGAEAQLRVLIERSTASRGASHADTLQNRALLARVVAAAGRLDEALGISEEIVIDAENASPERPGILGLCERNYGVFLKQAGRLEEAETHLLRAHDLILKSFGPESERTRSVSGALIDLYERMNQPEKALKFKP
ncbi:eukaryotic-like serine/threonine-protein kinase [Phycisphaerales bacterium]|nr:eukaryotic-like serine/threonine-protein kinase [Phycisphaerales bacterium]